MEEKNRQLGVKFERDWKGENERTWKRALQSKHMFLRTNVSVLVSVLLRFWQLEAINFRITRLIELDLCSLQLLIHFCFLDEVKDCFSMNKGNEILPSKHLENFCWWKVTLSLTCESKYMRWGNNMCKPWKKLLLLWQNKKEMFYLP